MSKLRTKEKKTTSRVVLQLNKVINQSESNESLDDINIYITNDVTKNGSSSKRKSPEIPIKIRNLDGSVKNLERDIYTDFATLFFVKPHTIMIPKKVKYLIQRDLPKHYLHRIHGKEKTQHNIQVAVELCFLFLSQLSSTHRNVLNGSNREGWKSLRAEYLRPLLRINHKTYQHVKKALIEFEYKSGPILEERFYKKGIHSYEYRLSEAFRSKGFEPYNLITKEVQILHKKSSERKLNLARTNIICSNLIKFYDTIILPTEVEIIQEAKRLIKLGYKNKKGKRLAFRNKRTKVRLSKMSNVSFVEDAVKIFKYLTQNGLIIPFPGDEKSGCRIVDSFVLMPSWIRKLIRINGEKMAEADYSCLHPNIAMTLYDGNEKYLNHSDLAQELGFEDKIVKIEHLSFFNKEVWQMKKSPLYNYYENKHHLLLKSIISEKNSSKFGHKVTSRRLFKKEVQIMSEVISRLNKERIYVGYVYDALFFDPAYSKEVVEIMNAVIEDLGVFTIAKLEY
ncbi:hypothetical protein DM790_25835 [Flavobacterium collinsii]|nr:hypothetical protein [Flavobacterium collinsii]